MKQLLYLVICIMFSMNFVYAQQLNISGKVTDEANQTLPGVNVVVKGTSKGTTTDVNGNYMLMNVKTGDILVFTFIGMQAQEVTIQNSPIINMTMNSQGIILEEVVSIGYGRVKKSDLAGSVSTYKMENIVEKPSLSVGDALIGKVSGVNIINNTGEPGGGISFNIRGKSTMSGNTSPLYVIDGQPVESGGGSASAGIGVEQVTERANSDPMATINPNDIESIEILKDASATAIYGSRGANGVVLITTKSGQIGRSVVKYSHRSDFSHLPKKLAVLNTNEYYQFLWESDSTMMKALPTYTSRFSSRQAAMNEAATMPDIDWQDITYGLGYSQSHNASISGGRKGENFLISGDYTDNNGIIRNSNYKRGGLRANYRREVSDKLTLDFKSYYSMTQRNQIPQSNMQGNLSSSVVLGAIAFPPNTTAMDSTGRENDDIVNNPLVLRKVPDRTDVNTTLLNLRLEYKLTDYLLFNVRGAYNSLNSVRRQYWIRGTWIGNTQNGAALFAENNNSNYLTEFMLNYDRTFARKHTVNAVGGYTWQRWYNNQLSQVNTGFPNDLLTYYSLQSAQYPGQTTTFFNTRALASYIGRVNYSYDKRYILVATGRFDGSTRLAKGNKWSFFPSVAGAWNVSQEEFMDDLTNVFSNLKLRASYGVTGNESIAIGATQARIGYNSVVLGQLAGQAYVQNSFASDDLRWESTAQTSLGVDVGFFNQKLELSLDFYQKNTTDLLFNKLLPGSATYGTYAINAGEIMNKGMDLELTYRIVNKKRISWDVSGNFSIVRNEVISTGDAGVMYGRSIISHGGYLFNQPANIAEVGSEIGAFYGYKTAGVYQNWAEVMAGPEPTIAIPGDVIFVDLNGDGVVNEADKTIIGSPYPDFTCGVSTNFRYKKFTLAATLVGSQGNQILNMNRWIMGTLNSTTGTNVFRDAWENRNRGEGTGNNIIPAPTKKSSILSVRLPDWMVEDASYFRIQNVSIGYNFDVSKIKSIRQFKVFATAANLLTLTPYTGYDPAISTFGDNALSPGIDLGNIPAPRTFSVGFDIAF